MDPYMTDEKPFSSKFIKNSTGTIFLLDILFSFLLVFNRNGDNWTKFLVYQVYAVLLLFFIFIFWLILWIFEKRVKN